MVGEIENNPPASTLDVNPSSKKLLLQKNKRGLIIIGAIIVVVLLMAGLFSMELNPFLNMNNPGKDTFQNENFVADTNLSQNNFVNAYCENISNITSLDSFAVLTDSVKGLDSNDTNISPKFILIYKNGVLVNTIRNETNNDADLMIFLNGCNVQNVILTTPKNSLARMLKNNSIKCYKLEDSNTSFSIS
jgi:hypothetical protein